MSDQEKFRAFKENAVKENEIKYGVEVRSKYGDGQADIYNQKILHMGEEEWNEFKELEAKILENLKFGVQNGILPESGEAKRIAALHKEWLCKTCNQYTPEMHKGIAQLYTADGRFTAYYDKEVKGCAKLLEQSVCNWADKI